MRTLTVMREITAAGLLLASYPLDLATRRAAAREPVSAREPVILSHGLGGNRSNLIGLAALLRLNGFNRVEFFEYPVRQSIGDSARALAELAVDVSGATGVHLIGHSLGGTISRRAASITPSLRVLSLVTLASPYSYTQISPAELAIFGDDDPIVTPPDPSLMAGNNFGRVIVLPDTGHLGVLYHGTALRAIVEELRANRPTRAAADGATAAPPG